MATTRNAPTPKKTNNKSIKSTDTPSVPSTTSSKHPWCPPFSPTFKILLLIRVLTALTSPISDCDETFNYWEPTHYLLHGKGLQTWEYDIQFQIRSWAYISLHAIIIKSFQVIYAIFYGMATTKLQEFYILRFALAIVAAYCETRFYRAVVEGISPKIGRYVLLFLACGTGMWIASTAFLPSSFALYTTLLASAFYIETPFSSSRRKTLQSILTYAVGTVWGWPFAGVMCFGFVLEELISTFKQPATNNQKLGWTRLAWLLEAGVASIFAVLAPLVLIDNAFYHTTRAIVPFNIVAYNVLSKSGGPELYGTEPWYFYFLNGFLNFNVVFIFAIASVGLLVFALLFTKRRFETALLNDFYVSYRLGAQFWRLVIKMIPFYLWFMIFTAQPHKEERFLSVSYPFLALNAALGVWTLFDVILSRKSIAKWLKVIVFTVFVVFSITRSMGLFVNYGSSIEIYKALHRHLQSHQPPTKSQSNICIGKEWYRFPSHFFLPKPNSMAFLDDGFGGILPAPFLPASNNYTGIMSWFTDRPGTYSPNPSYRMNSANRREEDRYVGLKECGYVVELFENGKVDLNAWRKGMKGGKNTTFAVVDLSTKYSEDFFTNSLVMASGGVRDGCLPFLNSAESGLWSRLVYLPDGVRGLIGVVGIKSLGFVRRVVEVVEGYGFRNGGVEVVKDVVGKMENVVRNGGKKTLGALCVLERRVRKPKD